MNLMVPSFVVWFQKHPDLDLYTILSKASEESQLKVEQIFRKHAGKPAPPNLEGLNEILGKEVAAMMVIAAEMKQLSSGETRKDFVIRMAIALMRYVNDHLASGPGEKIPQEAENQFLKPMVSDGIEQAYSILKDNGLI